MPTNNPSYGSVEVVCGCMFSGKSTELMRRVDACRAAGQRVQVFNSALDKRYAKKGIATHNKARMRAVGVASAKDILPLANPAAQVVAIDEINFFTADIVRVAAALAKAGKRVICCGLDLDWRGAPFQSTAKLLAIADKVDKLLAVCARCGKPATRTKRLSPIKSRIYVGGAHDYCALCNDCFDK